MEKRFQNEFGEIKRIIKKFHPYADISIVEEAFFFSKNAHEGQKRKSGEPYFIHPLMSAKGLAENGMDEVIVSAGLLHDVVEDTSVTAKEIRAKFGKKVSELVEGLTKLDRISFKSRQEHSTATIIKTISAASKDLRVLVIKIFDKLHNMETIRFLPREKQKEIATDVLTIYVPLIHKLGMHEMKVRMEELAFKTLEPKKYAKLMEKIRKNRKQKLSEIKDAVKILKKSFPNEKWGFTHETKSVFSHYSKMAENNKSFDEINDFAILKIIVPSEDDCYCTMGKVHSVFKPIPYKIKDFLAIPEYGIYRALHTQVIGPGKKPMKVYILTGEMDDVGENGVLSYLREGKTKELEEFTKLFPKITEQNVRNSKELAGSMDLDFHNNTMLVFYDGKSINLPVDSSILDLSFFINEKKALKSSAGKINGKIVPLWAKLKTGDRVKVIYSQSLRIQHGWLSFVNSEKAKNAISKLMEINPKRNMHRKNFIKLRIDAVDRPGLLSEQASILAREDLDMEMTFCKMNDDKTTGITEMHVREKNSQNLQKAVKKLKQMPETLNVMVEYP